MILEGLPTSGGVRLRARIPWGRVQWYALTLALADVVLAVGLVTTGVRLNTPVWSLLALAGIAYLAERQSIHLSAHTQTSVSVLPLLFAAVVHGPLAAMVVGACALLGDFGKPYTRWVIWTSSRALVGGLAGLVAMALLHEVNSFARLLIAVAFAALTEAIGDVSATTITAVLRGNASMETVRAMGRLLLATLPLYTPLITVLAFAYQELSAWTLLLFFVPTLAAQRLLVLYQEQRKLATELAEANIHLERANFSFASALVSALDARDRYTAGHSAAVAVYARDIAERLGLPEAQQQRAHLAGLLHDIGKVGLPPGLLEKTGPLTLEERRKMEEHSIIGERILANVEDYAEIAKIVRNHHERVDGHGYPDNLMGEEIPLISRILAVADAYNAMTSGRPYRDAMPSRVARFRLAQAADSQFDTSVVAAFEAILAGAGETYLSGARADFALEAQRHPTTALRVATGAA